ncbi:MAG: RCC1 domain-containing protein [Thermoleophilia bacterium]
MCVTALVVLVISMPSSVQALTDFPDVPASHPYHEAIAGMAEHEIIGGYVTGNFGPEDPVIRQQFAKMIVLTLGLTVTEDDWQDTAKPFRDLDTDDLTKLYPHEYVAVCARNNITKGTQDPTKFAPYLSISRQQVITMVVRAADNLSPGTLQAASAGWNGVLPAGDPTHGANIRKAEFNGLLAGIRASTTAPGLGGWNTQANASRGEVAQILWNLFNLGSSQASGWVSVDTGPYRHTLAIGEDGSLWAWGANNRGQLGDGTTTTRSMPTRIGTDTDWKAVAAGWWHSLALKEDGSLWAWGRSESGQVGDGTTTQRLVPTRIGADTDWAAIEAGMDHNLALKEDGSLWAWGYNHSGQLGNGNKIDRLSPIRVGNDTDWKAVSAGSLHSLALKENGSLWAWGDNGVGELGNGTKISSPVPTRVGAATDWKAIFAGALHSLAIRNDGSLWAWGQNSRGELGIGDTADRDTPTRVGADTDWKTAAAWGHSLAVKQDGSLWAWGRNDNGRLGDGTSVDRHTPTRIGATRDWEAVAAGYEHSLAIKTDASLWAWGGNLFGQLGDGTPTDHVTPGRVSDP